MKLTDEELVAFRDRALTASTYGHAIGVGEIYRETLAEELGLELVGDTSAVALLELANQVLEQRSPKHHGRKKPEEPRAIEKPAPKVEKPLSAPPPPPATEPKTEVPPPGDQKGEEKTHESPIMPPPPSDEGEESDEGEDEGEEEDTGSSETPTDQDPADKAASTGKKKSKKKKRPAQT